MRILDLRLAERALKGEGRPKVAGGSCAISRQMKREDYRRDKLTRQIDKEQRQMRERLNLVERNFLSDQMFKKDLNPFQTVIKQKSQMNQGSVRNKSDGHQGRNETFVGAVHNRQHVGSLPNIQAHHLRMSEQSLLERILHSSKYKPDMLPRGKSQILESSNEILNRNIFLQPVQPKQSSRSTQKRVTYQEKVEEIPRSSPFPRIECSNRNSHLGVSLQKEASKQDMDFPKLPDVPILRSNTIIGLTPGANVLRSALKKPGPPRFPPQPFSEPLIQDVPEVSLTRKPKKRVSFWDCGDKWEASMKSYENILTEVCRALSPGEARRAEEKRIEAEDAEGITQQREKILKQCRTAAEQDVFNDIRWKELMSTLGLQAESRRRRDFTLD